MCIYIYIYMHVYVYMYIVVCAECVSLYSLSAAVQMWLLCMFNVICVVGFCSLSLLSQAPGAARAMQAGQTPSPPY